MGKPTGFMEYKRETSKTIEPKERIRNFDEFHIPLSRYRVPAAWNAACPSASPV